MITFQQLQNATYQDYLSNPDVKRVFNVGYFGVGQTSRVDENIFNQQKPHVVNEIANMGGSELGRNVDRYINWNDPTTQTAANRERQLALDAIKESQDSWGSYGLDVSSIPKFQQYQQQLGTTPGGGQTSAQTAAGQRAPMGSTVSTAPNNPYPPNTPDWEAYNAKQANIASGMALAPGASGTTGGAAVLPGSVPNAAQINFKTGLTDAQKQSIQFLAANKPSSQWTDEDKKNWNYATNNQPLPQTGGGAATGASANVPVSGGTSSQGISAQATANPYPPNTPDWEAWNARAVTQGQAGTTGAAQSTDYRSKLQAMGVDVSQMSDTQVQWLGMMSDYQDTQAAKDKSIAPPSLSAQDMQSYLDQAHKELDPYNQYQFNLAKDQFMSSAAAFTQDFSYQQVQQEQANKVAQEQAAQQAAEAGLAQSGIRKLAEERMQTQQQGLVQSNLRSAQQTATSSGRSFESMYGQQGASVAQQAYAGTPYAYAPFGTPAGYGSAEQTQQQNIINRQSQLVQDALAGRQATQQYANQQNL